jgi:hypothetical protein
MNRLLMTMMILAGCDSSTTAVVGVAEFDRQLEQLMCDALFRCCASTKYADPASCANVFAASDVPKDAKLNAAIAAGYVTFDGVAAAACLDAYRAVYASCDHPLSVDPPVCKNWLYGVLPVGAACTGSDLGGRCAPGLYCGPPFSDTGVGTCAPLPIAGADCSQSGSECMGGAVCLPNQRCGMPLAAGQACDYHEQCQSDNCDAGVCSPSPRLLRDLVCK